jgi:pimeloyl-ACP methyl ester carboxylesterase
MVDTPEESGARKSRGLVRLRDGRVLAYAEYGSSTGCPVMFFHGTPGSRLAAVPAWSADRVTRIIAPDRPGIGFSDYQAGRTLLSWADDVAQLADELTLSHFAVAGVSGGGPHALACAYALPRRVVSAGVIAGPAPTADPALLEQMHGGNRLMVRLANRAPWALRPLLALNFWFSATFPEHYVRLGERALPPADRAAFALPDFHRAVMASAREATRQGSRALGDEVLLFNRPWGFDLGGITQPVHIWQGDADRNVPSEMARLLAAAIPNADLTVYPDEGHLVMVTHWPEIAGTLAGYFHSHRP